MGYIRGTLSLFKMNLYILENRSMYVFDLDLFNYNNL